MIAHPNTPKMATISNVMMLMGTSGSMIRFVRKIRRRPRIVLVMSARKSLSASLFVYASSHSV